MNELDEVETKLLLEGIRLRYGYDFRDYAEASMRRRVTRLMRQFHADRPIEILDRILREPEAFTKALSMMTVTTSEMFRDPLFYRALRERVCPLLRTFPTVTIWCAGCSTGEEVYSIAILLAECGLLDRSTIFATDINPAALKAAQQGIFSIEEMPRNIRNYQESGGTESFSNYYTADYGLVKMNSDLISNVVFSEHNLAMDHVFAECHLVLCRNVLIYFNKRLQERAFELFCDSLRHGGFLALGSKESLRFSKTAGSFEALDPEWKIYQKTVSGRRRIDERSFGELRTRTGRDGRSGAKGRRPGGSHDS